MHRMTWRSASILAVALLSVVAVGCESQPAQTYMNLPQPQLAQYSLEPAPKVVTPTVIDRPQVRQEPVESHPEWVHRGPANRWKYIVIHHSATDGGNAKVFDRAHRGRGWDELGYHFVICNGNGGDCGKVEVGSRWRKQKWGAHTGGTPDNEYNNVGIGICVVGSFQDSLPSRSQLNALRELVTWLAAKYDIPAQNVIGHQDAPNAATCCPGGRLHRYIKTVLRKDVAKLNIAQAD
ncbi:MAG: N-acetylmuramoyl-L-alanine amidase [Phycisphaerae bacterium]